MSLYYKSLPEAPQREYKEKLLRLGIKDLCFDPFIDGETWEDNVTKWPDVQFGEIYCYLVDTPGQFTRETLKAYRSLEAYTFFHSGWVQTVLSSTLGSDVLFEGQGQQIASPVRETSRSMGVRGHRLHHSKRTLHMHGWVSIYIFLCVCLNLNM